MYLERWTNVGKIHYSLITNQFSVLNRTKTLEVQNDDARVCLYAVHRHASRSGASTPAQPGSSIAERLLRPDPQGESRAAELAHLRRLAAEPAAQPAHTNHCRKCEGPGAAVGLSIPLAGKARSHAAGGGRNHVHDSEPE